MFASCFVIFPLSSVLIPPMCFNVAFFPLSLLHSFYLRPAARTIKPFPRTEAKDCKGCHRVNESILKRVSRFLRHSFLRSLSSRSFGNTLRKELKPCSTPPTREILLNFARRSCTERCCTICYRNKLQLVNQHWRWNNFHKFSTCRGVISPEIRSLRPDAQIIVI